MNNLLYFISYVSISFWFYIPRKLMIELKYQNILYIKSESKVGLYFFLFHSSLLYIFFFRSCMIPLFYGTCINLSLFLQYLTDILLQTILIV